MEIALEVVRMVLEYFGWDGHEIEVSLLENLSSVCVTTSTWSVLFKLYTINLSSNNYSFLISGVI